MTRPAALLQLHGAVVDLVYRVAAVPAAGEEALVTGFTVTAGGGFNAMAAARRWGMAVAYAGGIGAGPLGDLVARSIADLGIASLLPRDEVRDQGCCCVLVDDRGERTFIAAEGAEGHLAPGVLESLPVEAFGWRLMSGYTLHYRGARDALGRWLRGDSPAPGLVFDPSPVVSALDPALVRAALDRAAWISANAREAAALTGEADPERAAIVLAKGRDGGSVVRDGARGCVVAFAGRATHVAGHPVRPVDTTGAGDAHVGAFIAALAEGQPAVSAARVANIAAALSTLAPGPATAPDRSVVETIARAPALAAVTANPPQQRGERQ